VACGVDYEEIPWLKTTINRVWVKASYNGGLIVVLRREKKLDIEFLCRMQLSSIITGCLTRNTRSMDSCFMAAIPCPDVSGIG